MDPFLRGAYRMAESLDDPDELLTFAARWGLSQDPVIVQRVRYLQSVQQHNESERMSEDETESTPPQLPYAVNQTGEKSIKKFKAIERTFRITFNDPWMGRNIHDILNNLRQMFEDVLDPIISPLSGTDKIRIVVHHPSIDKPIIYSLRPISYLLIDDIMDTIENVLNSRQDLALIDGVNIDVGTIEMPKGGGSAHTITSIRGPNNSLLKKRSCVFIHNPDDNMCLARAIAVAFCHKYKSVDFRDSEGDDQMEHLLVNRVTSQKYYDSVRKSDHQEQKRFALKLHEMTGVPTWLSCTLNSIEEFEKVLNVNIFVVSSSLGNKFIRVCDDIEGEIPKDRLFLYLDDSDELHPHFHALVSITGFFGQSYFCQKCLKPYKSKKAHNCRKDVCFVCRRDDCEFVSGKVCTVCNLTSRSTACFETHKTNGQCENMYKCLVCTKVFPRKSRDPELHECGEWKCNMCCKFVSGQHLCYQRIPKAKTQHPNKFMFFDFETRQDSIYQCNKGYKMPQSCSECPNQESCSHRSTCENCHSRFCNQKLHIANYVVAQSACDNCKDKECESDSICFTCGIRCSKCCKWDKSKTDFDRPPCNNTCGFRQVVFEGDDVEQKFGQFLFSEAHKDFTVVAHNGRGYDFYFLLSYLIDQSIYPDNILYQGSKILCFHVGRGLNISFKDSLSFLPMKLSAMPKAFGFSALYSKGHFPHFFNTEENQTYKGPYPDPHFYGVDQMSSKDRTDFLQWHETKQHDTFDFRQEMYRYCLSDVHILRQACLRFRDLVLSVTGGKETGVDCFDYVTIASTCMGVFKRKFLAESWRYMVDGEWLDVTVKDGEIFILLNGDWLPIGEIEVLGKTVTEKEFKASALAHVPYAGYVSRTQYSKSSIAWLEWLMHTNQCSNIRHALNGNGEVKLPGTNYRVDGFAEPNPGDPCKGYCLEFLGCFYHGCKVCYPANRRETKDSNTHVSLAERYSLTQRREYEIKKMGYVYDSIWEHEFYEQLQSSPTMKQFVENLDLQERLIPRDSFYGGRTNGSTQFYRVEPEEEIRYVDFTSLYPYVQKYSAFPVGHPEIITDNFEDLSKYFGIVKLKILPPRNLYHPVLPFRHDKKLYFPLCASCCKTQNQNKCVHTDNQRALTGTWCTPEIQKAVSLGYQIVKIYEVYHFKETIRYDKNSDTPGLFSEYVDLFLKLKQEASGWPEWCQSDEDKVTYVRDYFEHEGIQLEHDKIEANPGLRSLAKLMLNNLWGKFAFNQSRTTKVSFYHTSQPEKFYSILCDKTVDVKDFGIINENALQLSWNHCQDNMPDHADVNVFIATFTTCWARLKLYSLLEMLNTRVLYYDTDSVIYVHRRELPDPCLGDHLGDLTNELDKNDYIKEFVCTGPKSYAYLTNTGKSVCKVKGFTLHYENSQLINFCSMRSMVLKNQRRLATSAKLAKISRQNHKHRLAQLILKKAKFHKIQKQCRRTPQSRKPTLTTTASKFRKSKQISKAEDPSITVTNPIKICRYKQKRKLLSVIESKRFKIVYTKRVLKKDLTTLPYGY